MVIKAHMHLCISDSLDSAELTGHTTPFSVQCETTVIDSNGNRTGRFLTWISNEEIAPHFAAFNWDALRRPSYSDGFRQYQLRMIESHATARYLGKAFIDLR